MTDSVVAMEAPSLSVAARALLRAHFDPSDLDEAEHRLMSLITAEGLALPEPHAALLERIRVAAIRVSDGQLDALTDAAMLARTDWRDLLVAGELAGDASLPNARGARPR